MQLLDLYNGDCQQRLDGLDLYCMPCSKLNPNVVSTSCSMQVEKACTLHEKRNFNVRVQGEHKGGIGAH